jgi:ABC-type nitrate/sulfonate/bicarbonate transport system substrate-binding protein
MFETEIPGCLTRRSFLIGLGATAATAACGGRPTPSKSPTSKTPITIRFSTVSAGATGFATHVLIQRKIDAKHGIALDVAASDPAAAEKAVLLRRVDAGLYPIVSAARANLEGQPITIFGPLLWNHNYGLTYADRPYQKLADLRGKRIATLDPISTTYQAAQVVAGMQGLNFARDFNVVTSPAPAVLAFLARGDVDGIIHFEPNIGNLLSTGKYKIFADFNDAWKKAAGQNMFSVGLAAHDDWIKQNREGAQRLVRALLESGQVINSDPGVFEQYADFLGLDTAAKVKAAQERMPRLYPTVWNKSVADSAELVIKRAAELKVIDAAPSRRVTLIL